MKFKSRDVPDFNPDPAWNWVKILNPDPAGFDLNFGTGFANVQVSVFPIQTSKEKFPHESSFPLAIGQLFTLHISTEANKRNSKSM